VVNETKWSSKYLHKVLKLLSFSGQNFWNLSKITAGVNIGLEGWQNKHHLKRIYILKTRANRDQTH